MLILKNIKGLVQARTSVPARLAGKEMAELPVIENAWLCVREGRIEDFGQMESLPDFDDNSSREIIDCTDKFVFPTWVDSHTHIVYAGNREGEFVDRIKGMSYAEIAEKGGGILNSAAKLGQTDESELFDQASQRLQGILKTGTGAVEIKSGYGLTTDSELKMLRVIRKLKESHPLPIKATFLGAHAIPRQFRGDKEGYLRLI
ncbi:MAG: imidazolonepropionase, partial [Flavobacteriales bacterium]|nr:imidazolonepropionase [Flavobacteriales bacterium]